MSKRQIEARRRRNQQIAAKDAKNRCAFCKRALPKEGVQMLWHDPRKFCNQACLEDAKAAGMVR